jgi:formylmethanofuran dehydrogenase subunit E
VLKSENITEELLCDRCGKPVGDIWYMTNHFEVVCIPCWSKGEGRVAS